MAHRSKPTKPAPTAPTIAPERALGILKTQIDKGNALLAEPSPNGDGVMSWGNTTHQMLIASFGSDSDNVASFVRARGPAIPRSASPGEVAQVLRESLRRRVKLVEGCVELLQMLHLTVEEPRSSAEEASMSKSTIKIFLSHAASNANVAKALAHMIESAFVVPANTIRCTSVAGFKLTPGDHASDTLRDDIAACDILVGLLTEESIASGYVVMEIGAAWGQQKVVCGILAPSLPFGRVPGPFKEHHAVKWDDGAGLTDLIESIGKATKLPKQNAGRQRVAVDDFLRLIANLPDVATPALASPPLAVSDADASILLEGWLGRDTNKSGEALKFKDLDAELKLPYGKSKALLRGVVKKHKYWEMVSEGEEVFILKFHFPPPILRSDPGRGW
jgi:hypothetical protein